MTNKADQFRTFRRQQRAEATEYARNLGICRVHPDSPALPNSSQCRQCSDKQQAGNNRRRQEKTRCKRCGVKTRPLSKARICTHCRKYNREYGRGRMRAKRPRAELQPRNAAITDAFKAGESINDIAEQYNLSRARVYQIVKNAI